MFPLSETAQEWPMLVSICYAMLGLEHVGKIINNYNMPQLLPFYFVNQFVFALAALFTITYVMSRYVMPYFVALFVTRVYITKL